MFSRRFSAEGIKGHKTNWVANIVSQNRQHGGMVNLRGCRLSFIFTHKRSAADPLSELERTHILYTKPHTHIPASCLRLSSPRYQNSVFPLFKMWSSLQKFFPPPENESSQFSTCCREYDECQLFLSIVIRQVKFYQRLFAYSSCTLSRLQG